ncbi:unnamed protein product, partial [Mesorhabditis spiculigera]
MIDPPSTQRPPADSRNPVPPSPSLPSPAPVKRVRLRTRDRRDSDPQVFIFYPPNPTYNPTCNETHFPDKPDWRDNVLRYDKEVDGIACVVYKPCYDLDDEAKKLYHCSDVSTTTSTKKITTTTTAKTTPTTTKEPDTLMSDEVVLVAALVGALVLIIIVVIIVLCCCLKKKKRGNNSKKPVVDDMMNVGAGAAVVDLDVAPISNPEAPPDESDASQSQQSAKQ